MPEEQEKPTLLTLSTQLWDILNELDCYEDCLAECTKNGYCPNEEFLDEVEVIEFGIELLQKVLAAKITAIRIFNSVAKEASAVLDELSQCLEAALRRAEWNHTFVRSNERLTYNEKCEPPRVCLHKDIFRPDRERFDVIERVARETAAAYALEQCYSDNTELNVTGTV
jgi:hypothetical protein